MKTIKVGSIGVHKISYELHTAQDLYLKDKDSGEYLILSQGKLCGQFYYTALGARQFTTPTNAIKNYKIEKICDIQALTDCDADIITTLNPIPNIFIAITQSMAILQNHRDCMYSIRVPLGKVLMVSAGSNIETTTDGIRNISNGVAIVCPQTTEIVSFYVTRSTFVTLKLLDFLDDPVRI